MTHDSNHESLETKMNDGYAYSTDYKKPEQNNTSKSLKGIECAIDDNTKNENKENENESKNGPIGHGIGKLIFSVVPSDFHNVYTYLQRKLLLQSKDLPLDNFAKGNLKSIKKFISAFEEKSNNVKMSLYSMLTKLMCLRIVTCSIGGMLILLLCMFHVTYSETRDDGKEVRNVNLDDKLLDTNISLHRSSRKFEKFKSSARTSEELLNDITTFGLERSRYLYEIKEKRIYDSGIRLKKTDPAHFVAVFNKQTPRAKELSRYGYATLEASSLLTKQ